MTGAFSDITDRYELLEEDLVYVDAPLEGFLRRRSDGALFAFRCRQLLGSLVFHWTLVPVDSTDADVSETFGRAATTSWISIVEDRRTSSPVLVAVEIPSDRYPLPV